MTQFVIRLEKEYERKSKKIELSDLNILRKSLEASLVLGDAFCLIKLSTIILTIFPMRTLLFNSRFMRVAINGLPVEMSREELDIEFENFQDAVRELLLGDEGYIAIDFKLNDLLAILCEVHSSKKKCTLSFAC